LVIEIMRQAQANLTKSAPTWEAYLDILEARNGLKEVVDRIRWFERSLRFDEANASTDESKGPGEE
jgi:formylmethanofuran dehydrogenase subunit E-like metal-binding protein